MDAHAVRWAHGLRGRGAHGACIDCEEGKVCMQCNDSHAVLPSPSFAHRHKLKDGVQADGCGCDALALRGPSAAHPRGEGREGLGLPPSSDAR
ncbi:hypothetical protein AB1Y20_011849 [Prymnesium parvum]|uniref:RING-type E3 ubiquitin transferase n=1 Tax=Prymnesium parvum TaxID=97485 RepID=A0AB34IKL5_PRYPA